MTDFNGNNLVKQPTALIIATLLATNRLDDNFNLKEILPKSLYANVKQLRRISKYTCSKCFEEMVENASKVSLTRFLDDMLKCYIDKNDFCLQCIHQLRQLTVSQYSRRMLVLLSCESYWYRFYEHFYGMAVSDIIYWDFKSLSLDQMLLLKTHPFMDNLPYCGSYVRLISTYYMTEYNGLRYCSGCIDCQVDKILIKTVYTRLETDRFIFDYLWDNTEWCVKCEKVPLFEILRTTGSHHSLDILCLKKLNLSKDNSTFTTATASNLQLALCNRNTCNQLSEMKQ